MKQAILVVAFGSTVDSAREHQIDAVVNRIKERYTCLLYTSFHQKASSQLHRLS